MFELAREKLGICSVWVLDFEFETDQEHPLPKRVVCMVAKDTLSGLTLRLGPSELTECPFQCDETELFVPFYAVAEASCFLKLGWQLPPLWLDIWAEEKRMLNGTLVKEASLLAALRRHGLPIREVCHKTYWQQRIGKGEWTSQDVPKMLDYCEEDVLDTEILLRERIDTYLSHANSPDPKIALGQAIIRGRFIAECARITHNGMPVDVDAWALVSSRFEGIKQQLIAAVDKDFGVYDSEGRFSKTLFEQFLLKQGIPWPRSKDSAALSVNQDTFVSMSRAYPELGPLQELRRTLGSFRRNTVLVDLDGRSRANMRPLGTKTGRCTPSNSKFFFGLPAWARSFLEPPPGFTLAYLDYASQEIAIGAALSGDSRMIEAYKSGDPYLQFAKDAKLAPLNATKQSHKAIRSRCKQIVLGVNYGMGPASMAVRADISEVEAKELLNLHRETYSQYWSWVEMKRNHAALGLPLYSPCGWRIQTGIGVPLNERSNGNWTVQTTGSDILRVATILAADAGLKVIATVHDALFFEFPTEVAEILAGKATSLMERAAESVIGISVRVDAELFSHPNRYVDEERGAEFFERITRLAAGAACE